MIMDKNSPIADHDLLIKLDTKMDALSQSFADFHSNLATRVLKIETRLDQNDIFHASIDLKHFQDNSQWVDKFRANMALLVASSGILIATLGGVISSLMIKWFKI